MKKGMLLLAWLSVLVIMGSCQKAPLSTGDIQAYIQEELSDALSLYEHLVGLRFPVDETVIYIEDGIDYCRVADQRYATMAHLTDAMYGYFTNRFIRDHLEMTIAGETPLYREIDGHLCARKTWEGRSMENVLKPETLRIVEQDGHLVRLVIQSDTPAPDGSGVWQYEFNLTLAREEDQLKIDEYDVSLMGFVPSVENA